MRVRRRASPGETRRRAVAALLTSVLIAPPWTRSPTVASSSRKGIARRTWSGSTNSERSPRWTAKGECSTTRRARSPRRCRCYAESRSHTYSLYLTYRQYECQGRRRASEATRAPLSAARELFTERGVRRSVHRGDRAGRRRHARRPVPPLPRQAGALPRGGARRSSRRSPSASRPRPGAERPVAAAARRGRTRSWTAASTRRSRRIMLIDAPSVLGPGGMAGDRGTSTAWRWSGTPAGPDRRRPDRAPALEPLAHLLLGALTEAGLLIARAEEPQKAARAEVGGAHRAADGRTAQAGRASRSAPPRRSPDACRSCDRG